MVKLELGDMLQQTRFLYFFQLYQREFCKSHSFMETTYQGDNTKIEHFEVVKFSWSVSTIASSYLCGTVLS